MSDPLPDDEELWRTHARMCGASGGAVLFRREFYRCAKALGLWPSAPAAATSPSERRAVGPVWDAIRRAALIMAQDGDLHAFDAALESAAAGPPAGTGERGRALREAAAIVRHVNAPMHWDANVRRGAHEMLIEAERRIRAASPRPTEENPEPDGR